MLRDVTPLLLALILFVWTHPLAANAQSSVATAQAPTISDSPIGLQSQFEELIRVARSNDPTGLRVALDSVALPSPDGWFAQHFAEAYIPQLKDDYSESLDKMQSHITGVMQNFSKYGDFGLRVEKLGPPDQPAATGFEALLPRPLDNVVVEVYRISSSAKNAKHGPPSWVSSFVYVGDRFRYLGGTYPFWFEKLTLLRGPMAIPSQKIGDMNVQAVPFHVDPKTPGVVGVVQLEVKIGTNGHASMFNEISGDPARMKTAEDYVRDWEFPHFATTLELDVAFFRQ